MGVCPHICLEYRRSECGSVVKKTPVPAERFSFLVVLRDGERAVRPRGVKQVPRFEAQ